MLEPLGSASRIALGTVLREIRIQKGIAQRDVGLAIGCGADTIRLVETGRRKLLMLEFLEICRVLGVDTDTVIRRMEERMRA